MSKRFSDSKWSRGSRTSARTAEEPARSDAKPVSESPLRRPRKWPYPEEPAETPADVPEPARTSQSRRRRGGSSGGGGGSVLPDLPDEPGGGGSGRKPNAAPVIFGVLLFAAMGLFLLNPGGIFPSIGGDDPVEPTPSDESGSMIVPTSVNTVQTEATEASGNTEGGGGTETGASRPEVICIDAGHGGWDTGYTREANERAPAMQEADLNLAMSYMLKDALEAEGFTVILTRPSGTAVNVWNEDVNGDGRISQNVQIGADDQDGNRDELQARINICNEAGADILISVHLNGVDDTRARGYEVIYTAERDFGQQNADLAYFVYTSLQQSYEDSGFDIPGRGIKADSTINVESQDGERQELHYIMTGPAVNAADFSITPSAMPGIICEALFITNDADAAFIADAANQHLIVQAYVEGILAYFDRYPGDFQGG